MNRREFCRYATVIGGSVMLTSLANACRQGPSVAPIASPAASASPTGPDATSARVVSTELAPSPSAVPTDVNPTTQVTDAAPQATSATLPDPAAWSFSQIALVREDDRAAGVAKAMALLGAKSLSGKHVVLKPNFNSADPSPGSTHPDVLRVLLTRIRELGAGRITLVDRSGMGDTRKVMERIGAFDLISEFDCEAIVLDELAEDEWVLFRQSGQHWQDGFPIPKLLLDADVVVQTCNLKTHRYGGHFTLSLKNSVGLVAKKLRPSGHDYMTELHNSPHQRLMIAEINAAYEPDLIVLDGIEAFVSGGPAEGKRVKPKVILAGHDRVALDAAGVAILRMFGTTPEVSRGRVFDQEQIARAAELGLGAAGPEQVEFITADEESQQFANQVREILIA